MGSFIFRSAGESHGKGLTALVEGIPAGLQITEDYIHVDMARRQKGYGRGGRMLIEKDHAEILTGVRHGVTLGSPISMWIENKDWENWKEPMSIGPSSKPAKLVTRLRPGHADLPGVFKYNQVDVRNILERSSARETAARVAAGAIAKRFLEEFGIQIHAHVISVGTIKVPPQKNIDWARVEESEVRVADPALEKSIIALIDAAKEAGDTLGGIYETIATGVPVGLGTHVQWDRKLSTRLAAAFMSVNATKAVEIGIGFSQTELPGSKVHDIIELAEPGSTYPFKRLSNNAGGLEGGMSNGEPVVVRAAIKPISTLSKPLPSIDLHTGKKVQAHYERSDICQVPPACVIGEAMMAMVIADAMLEKFGGDHMEETKRNYRSYMQTVRLRGEGILAESERPADDA